MKMLNLAVFRSLLFASILAFCLIEFDVSTQSAPKKLLVVTVTKGFRHSSIPTAEKVLAELGK
jgi:hypothetical protein